MADVGYISLFIALVASVYAAFAFIYGTKNKLPVFQRSARNGLLASTMLITLAVIVLLIGFITHNYRIEYIASYSNNTTPLAYLISGLWAGNQGSLMFWAWVLSLFAAGVTLQKRSVGSELLPYASAIIMVTLSFFLLMVIFISNPFVTLGYLPADGMGLNPLLQNPGMIVHPPALLAGYVGFTIPFSFAMSALITRHLNDDWIMSIRRWTLLTWLFLGAGNIIGAWWAYNELGWGGFWAWDPVENAGLMPWLVATAFLHSIMMQRRRGMLKIWNMSLIIATFSLSIFGTFLTRSGVLSSVHAFNDTNLGPFFLVFLIIVLVGSIGLLLYRRDDLKGESEMESLVSRESTFLINNLLLVGSAFAVFLGTIFPVISEAIRGTKITVGAPFFDQVNGPIFLAIILLAGICTLIGWRRASIKNLLRTFIWPLVGAVIVAIILISSGIGHGYAIFGFILCSFVLFTILYEWFRGTRARHRMRGDNYLKAFFGLIGANRPRYGGYIVHIAIIFMAVGVIGTMVYGTETEVSIKTGATINIGNYSLKFDQLNNYQTASRQVTSATFSVTKDNKPVGDLVSDIYTYQNYQPVTEVGLRSRLDEDLYVILIGTQNGVTAFKVLVNPLVDFLWLGGGLLLVGGLIAMWPERQKLPAS